MAGTIEALKRNFFDSDKVIKAVDATMRRKLSKFGAFVRTRSRSSIRKRKAVSEPGTPPTNRTGLLKKFIFFAYDEQTKTVVIGPAAFRENATAPELLEHGGTVQGNGRVVWLTNVPSRDSKGRFVSEGKRRVELHGDIVYKPRPFMQPAFETELPKFLTSLKDSVKG